VDVRTLLLAAAGLWTLLGCGKEPAAEPAAVIKPPAAARPVPSETRNSEAAATAVTSVPADAPAVANPPQSKADPARQALADLVASLQNANPDAWQSAEARLKELGKAAVPALAAGLKNTDRTTREMATMFLAQLGPDALDAADALAGVLRDESAFVRVNAASALTTMDRHIEQAIPVLADLLSDSDPNVQTTAVIALGNVGPQAKPAVPKLIELLTDTDQRVQVAATRTLGRLGQLSQPAVLPLTQLTEADDAELREAAGTALKQIQTAADGTGTATIPAGAVREANGE
jgi:HEAT repeat protein